MPSSKQEIRSGQDVFDELLSPTNHGRDLDPDHDPRAFESDFRYDDARDRGLLSRDYFDGIRDQDNLSKPVDRLMR